MCEECRAILQALRDTMAELREMSDRSRPKSRRVVEALLRGAPEDVDLVEEFFSEQEYARYTLGYPKVLLAMTRKLAHEQRTGHRIDWNPWDWRPR